MGETKKEPLINIICFIIIGWVNNFGYCVMLSAAKDLIGDKAPTSTVLLCDILPAFLVKLTFPFFLEKIPYVVKVCSVVVLALVGFILASFADVSTVLALSGVVGHSLSNGLGEITFLAYSVKFSTKCVSGWSIGTGLAGITSAGLYAILADVFNVHYKIILYVFLPIPLLMLEAYYISNPAVSPGQGVETTIDVDAPEDEKTHLLNEMDQELINSGVEAKLSVKDKLTSLMGIWEFLFSLFLVYISEYMINQSVNAVIDFPGTKYEGKYYTFSQFAYQTGVFLSRSSLTLFTLPSFLVMVPSILQFIFLVLFCFEAVNLFIPWFWFMLALVFVEGLWGGLVYVSAMYWISVRSDKRLKEFRMSIASLFNSCGILGASMLGIWLEPYLMKIKKW